MFTSYRISNIAIFCSYTLERNEKLLISLYGGVSTFRSAFKKMEFDIMEVILRNIPSSNESKEIYIVDY